MGQSKASRLQKEGEFMHASALRSMELSDPGIRRPPLLAFFSRFCPGFSITPGHKVSPFLLSCRPIVSRTYPYRVAGAGGDDLCLVCLIWEGASM